MSDVPIDVITSELWKIIEKNSQLLEAVKAIRSTAEAISAKTSELLPGFTDHSVKHMDSLWKITEIVFTEAEVQNFSIGEAFILACSFYVHDLGMAYCVTEEGKRNIENTPEYQAIVSQLMSNNISEGEASFKSLQIGARKIHAEKALELVQEKLPGLDRYLIESTELRQKWGEHIGQVSSSHHWSLHKLDEELGKRNKIPDALGESDLGLVACALRVIDYADINSTRASTLERLLRKDIGRESLVHWLGQENIEGPIREDNKLKYSSTQRIENVDAWWKFYELASGVNKEIISVSDYLDSRSCSKERFSLQGVKGIESTEEFVKYVQTKGFEPIDVRFRADSIERLINLLGGKQLYGEDYLAPIRELIQNANDAVHLFRTQYGNKDHGEILVQYIEKPEYNELIVADNGVGMSKNIITKYLLSIASDYWNSDDFIQDYPQASVARFRPAGRFGIGFLSVFMVSGYVEVATEKIGNPRLTLRIEGLGKRGYLETETISGRNGTSVSIQIADEFREYYKDLEGIIKKRAPMLDIPVRVRSN
ncbi:MAG TPA: hypothetical protein G4O10_07895 [Dehalococcoidia bacterium]|nr:hypothetical protein [Dehalococcoidia bacterium]